ncbi:hypothetical protein SI65_02983 [Aspergillus cristatus]|uniref:Uncharacterized protein n=1 Tax=Aspergillus cristatus TaxID=573508 RepID=A0A1E3BML5_ASPCR|nr:hypothetical protein SI65_02983 [Aspergillus cristatus]
MVTARELVQKYHAAEKVVIKALRAAQNLDGHLTQHLNQAFNKGHEAEKLRGDWITSGYRPEDIKNEDIGHLEAVEWIDENIMQPSQEIADRREIRLS